MPQMPKVEDRAENAAAVEDLLAVLRDDLNQALVYSRTSNDAEVVERILRGEQWCTAGGHWSETIVDQGYCEDCRDDWWEDLRRESRHLKDEYENG